MLSHQPADAGFFTPFRLINAFPNLHNYMQVLHKVKSER